MKYCVDNSFCPFRIQSGSFFECNAVEYCAFQRPNELAISQTEYQPYNAAYCQCGTSAGMKISRYCRICGRIKW
jgi:hypothetical protein